jgi:predicted alpha/beta-fold hydrolase
VLDKLKYCREFDDLIIVKMFDFESVDDYYIKSSSMNDISQIKVPSLFINAKNDIVSPIDCVDENICNYLLNLVKNNRDVILLRTKYGGHTCWFSGFFRPKRVSF